MLQTQPTDQVHEQQCIALNEELLKLYNTVPTANAICEVKAEHSGLKPMKNLSHHTDLS
jgi:hypothetical protein